MRKLLIFSLTFVLFACEEDKGNDKIDASIVKNTASADGKKDSDLPEIKFEEEEFDFGKITQGERVTHSFTFKNTGRNNLVISSASAGCGCTIPTWPKHPIKSGEEAAIEVIFNSEGKSGYQEKAVTIVTNCEPATRVVKIKADVIVPEVAK